MLFLSINPPIFPSANDLLTFPSQFYLDVEKKLNYHIFHGSFG